MLASTWDVRTFLLSHRYVQESVPVTIVDDDDGGMLTFELPTKEVSCAHGRSGARSWQELGTLMETRNTHPCKTHKPTQA